MSDSDHEQEQYAKRDRLDRDLDAALAKYAAVGPRPSLEERVLANLKAERAKVLSHAWWRWSVAFAMTAVVVAALVVGWKSETSRPVVVNHPTPSAPSQNESRTNVAANRGAKQVRPQGRVPKRATPIHSSQPALVATANPKLDQFPSPQPLTEQEKILASYVAQFHAQAVLIARVANAELQKDRAEVIGKPQSPAGPIDHGDQETSN
jgi:hypothetical protein